MSSTLSAIPVEKRKQVAAALGLFAMLFLAVGAVAATGASTGAIKAFVGIALVVAVLLALLAWGVLHSVRAELAERRLDATIEATITARGGRMCDCGHDHDPDEMHLVGDGNGVEEERGGVTADGPSAAAEVCAHDGSGADCSHSCEVCVLAAMRPAPDRTRAERRVG